MVREKLTYANVMATIAVFVAIGGGAYAAGVAKNSVGTKQIKDGAVKDVDVARDSLTGAVVDEATLSLPQGPQGLAGPAGATGPQGPAGSQGLAGQDGSPDSAAQVLAKLLTADGNGSGLDADTIDGLTSSQLAQATGPWHNVGGAGEPPFTQTATCTWENWLNGWPPAGFVRDSLGFVHLRGRVFGFDAPDPCVWSTTLSRVIFHLPPGFRPELSELMPVFSDEVLGYVYVLNDGQVRVEGAITPDEVSSWLNLDGITFRCAPPGVNGCP